MSRRGWTAPRPPDGLIKLALTGANTVGLFAVSGPVRWVPTGLFVS